MNTKLAFAFTSFACALAVACGGSSSSSDDGSAQPGDEQDVKSGACAPITTLTCEPGYESTTDGCASPRIAGSPPYGRCVSVASKAVIGTWTSGPKDEDDLLFYSFSFASDGTYEATGGCRPNPSGPSCFAITKASGKYTVTRSGPQLGSPAGADEIVLTDSFKQKTSYFFSVDGKKLELSTVFNGKKSVFEKK
ncbi:MAG TPA: hypothetical protein VIF62_01665 [Labilithrix sp.]